MNHLGAALQKFSELYKTKAEKISAEQDAYQMGVHELPGLIKETLRTEIPFASLAFEGSVGKGSWSRTPWVAIYDTRITERASDGFYVAILLSEDKESLFLVLMNTSSSHINYQPYKLSAEQVGGVAGFEKGRILKGQLSHSGRGSGPGFEQSSLLWKKFDVQSEEMENFADELIRLVKLYVGLADIHASIRPSAPKPFKINPFLIR